MSIFQQQNSTYKELGKSMAHLKEKKKIERNCPREKPDGKPTRQRL